VGVIWAGKRLPADEELQLRRTVALLRRIEEQGSTSDDREVSSEARMDLERFLPENGHRWTPNELETGAYLGPWMIAGATINGAIDGQADPLEG
jgi:hypothetical protein